jgi:hypothetical protein
VVLAADEAVDLIIDIPGCDQLDADGDDSAGGLDRGGRKRCSSPWTGSRTTPATPRLRDAVDAARREAAHQTPFGFDPAAWKDIVGQADGLRGLLETEEEIVDDVAVEDAAKALHTTLRPFV